MPWSCTGFDHSDFTNIEDALFHQRTFPDHIVEEVDEKTRVGVADFGYVTLRGPDGRVKQVTDFN